MYTLFVIVAFTLIKCMIIYNAFQARKVADENPPRPEAIALNAPHK